MTPGAPRYRPAPRRDWPSRRSRVLPPPETPQGQAALRALFWNGFFVVCGLCAGWRLRALGYPSGFGAWQSVFDVLFAAFCPTALLLWAGAGRWGWLLGAAVLLWQAAIVGGAAHSAAIAGCGALALVVWTTLSTRILTLLAQLPPRPALHTRMLAMARHFAAAAVGALLTLGAYLALYYNG